EEAVGGVHGERERGVAVVRDDEAVAQGAAGRERVREVGTVDALGGVSRAHAPLHGLRRVGGGRVVGREDHPRGGRDLAGGRGGRGLPGERGGGGRGEEREREQGPGEI